MKVTSPNAPGAARRTDASPQPKAPATTPGQDAAPTGWAPRTAAARSVSRTDTSPAPAAQPPAAGADAGLARANAALDAALDTQTMSRRVSGNQVTMLFDGVNSFAERDRLIDGAKESICLQTFIFTSDDTGWALARKLADKARAGVEVRVLVDAMGSGRSDPALFDLMREAGVEVKTWAPKWQVWDINDRWHEKHLIVDGRTSIEGGMNIADEYALGGSGKQVFSRGDGAGTEAWRDADIKLEGPAVQDATRAFLRNWEQLGGTLTPAQRGRLLPVIPSRPGGATVRVVQSNPQVSALAGTTERLYRDAISRATKSITIENAYFLPPPSIRSALVDAARRGVDVEVLTNSRESNDMGFVSDAARYFYDELLAAGVKIHEKQGGTLHAKTATFDGEYSLVGSFNLNGRSVNQDAEVVLAVEDGATAGQLEARFRQGLEQSRPITSAELNREGFVTNLKQWALSTLAWTF